MIKWEMCLVSVLFEVVNIHWVPKFIHDPVYKGFLGDEKKAAGILICFLQKTWRVQMRCKQV